MQEAKVKLDPKEWQAGFDAGRAGQRPHHAGAGTLSWISGYIEGKAQREKEADAQRRLKY